MKTRLRNVSLGLLFTLCLIAASAARAEQDAGIQITIRSGQFEPTEITIPAGKKVKLMVNNQSALPAEIESNDFTMEKVIPGHSEVALYVGPLKAGQYSFFNDFAQNVKGKIIVK